MEREIVGMKMVGDYIACSNGRIFKLNWHGTGRTREINQSDDGKGYLKFWLNNTVIRTHRFIAMCFIPNPNNLPEINHKNEIKTDNRVENLEWCDRKYNVNYGNRTNKAAKSNVGKLLNRLDMSKSVEQYSKAGELIATYPSAKEAQRQTGIRQGAISACCLGKPHYNTAGGFIWKFKL